MITWTRLELVLVIVGLLAVIVGFYLRGLAGRLDRLHLRVEASTAALTARLERRAALAQEVALAGVLDPASSVLLLTAATARDPGGGSGGVRYSAESDLSAALRAVFADPVDVNELLTVPAPDGVRDVLHELGQVCIEVVLARRFADDATRAAAVVRRRLVVRALHLAGHAPWPTSHDMDDAPPEGLTSLLRNSA